MEKLALYNKNEILKKKNEDQLQKFPYPYIHIYTVNTEPYHFHALAAKHNKCLVHVSCPALYIINLVTEPMLKKSPHVGIGRANL